MSELDSIKYHKGPRCSHIQARLVAASQFHFAFANRRKDKSLQHPKVFHTLLLKGFMGHPLRLIIQNSRKQSGRQAQGGDPSSAGSVWSL